MSIRDRAKEIKMGVGMTTEIKIPGYWLGLIYHTNEIGIFRGI